MSDLLLRMLERLTWAYNHAPEGLIGRLFSIYAGALENVEGALQVTRQWRNINTARGRTLDRIGMNFGVARPSPSDDFYRLLIITKVISLLSGGDSDTVIRAAGELLGVDYADILLEDVYPAKVALYVDQALISQQRLALIEQILTMLKRILAAGVGLRLYLRSSRTYHSTITICRGAIVRLSLTGAPPIRDHSFAERRSHAYGAACQVEIRTKRID